jgi:hypothetical protein
MSFGESFLFSQAVDCCFGGVDIHVVDFWFLDL